MKTIKITESEISDLKISSLPTRPTAPASFGGKGYTATEMKSAFDKLPLFIIERFNSLLNDISATDSSSVSSSLKTGIEEGHTLFDMFSDIKSGKFAGYLQILDDTLANTISYMKLKIAELQNAVDFPPVNIPVCIDCGTPEELSQYILNGGIL